MKEIETTKKYYNKYGQLWVDSKTNSFYNEKAFTKLVSLLPAKGNVLDIGCTHGIHVPMFCGIGRHLSYTGIDISRFFIKIAKRRYPQLAFLESNIADSSTLPFKRRSFVGFFCGSTIQHIPFTLWDETFANIETFMKKGAYGFISLPIAHPTTIPKPDDTRNFTLMSEKDHIAYFKKRGYQITVKGIHDGFTTAGIWRWYIVKLPE